MLRKIFKIEMKKPNGKILKSTYSIGSDLTQILKIPFKAVAQNVTHYNAIGNIWITTNDRKNERKSDIKW